MSAVVGEGGWLAVVGTGPGDSAWMTPETSAVIAAATDLVGYERYVERVADSGPDVGEDFHRRDGAVQLAPPMIGQHQTRYSPALTFRRVFHIEHTLDDHRKAGLPHEPVQILPARSRCHETVEYTCQG